LGIGQRPGASQLTPVPVSGGHTFAALSGGGEMFCGLMSSTAVWCWGGQVGGETAFFRDSLPTLLGGSVSIVNITSGPFHTCGLTSAGDAYCWGQNVYGQLGTGDTVARTTPGLVSGGLKWSAISVGFWHTCGVTTDSKAYCWGYPAFGALGVPAVDTNPSQTIPLAVTGGLAVASISAGAVYTCAVTTTGAGYCWGNNIIGQLGDGTDSNRDAPAAVAQPSGLALSKIVVSRANDIFSTSCGVTSGGAAYCWGSGTHPNLQRELRERPFSVQRGAVASERRPHVRRPRCRRLARVWRDHGGRHRLLGRQRVWATRKRHYTGQSCANASGWRTASAIGRAPRTSHDR
jgi:alpha-tubulin suppressor-like RCC1 family protein